MPQVAPNEQLPLFRGLTATGIVDAINKREHEKDIIFEIGMRKAGLLEQLNLVDPESLMSRKMRMMFNQAQFPYTFGVSAIRPDKLKPETVGVEQWSDNPDFGSAKTGTVTAKSMTDFNAWRLSDFVANLDPSLDFIPAMAKYYGQWKAQNVNTRALHMIRNLNFIDDLVIKQSGASFPELMKLAEKKRGARYFSERRGTLIMSHTTLRKLLENPDSKVTEIQSADKYNTKDGSIVRNVGNYVPECWYNAQTPIVCFDSEDMPDEKVILIRSGCVSYADRTQLGYDDSNIQFKRVWFDNAVDENKTGSHRIKMIGQYALHIEGTTFTGTLGTDYSTPNTLTDAELLAKKLYDLKLPVDQSFVYFIETGTL